MLAAALQIETRDILISNDAACFLQGEVFGGAAKGFQKAMGITLGTGLGSAVYRNGKAIDGDLWRMPFKMGILEDYISARWFIKKYKELTGQQAQNVKELIAIAPPEIKEEIFNEFGGNLYLFLHCFAQLLEPECIVVGGNIAKGFQQFGHALSKLGIPVVVSSLGENAALIGAAGYWEAE